MADGMPFKEANGEMGVGDHDPKRVYALPCHHAKHDDGTREVITCWRLTIPEIEEITRTGRLWLRVMGSGMPPVAIEAFSPFEVRK